MFLTYEKDSGNFAKKRELVKKLVTNKRENAVNELAWSKTNGKMALTSNHPHQDVLCLCGFLLTFSPGKFLRRRRKQAVFPCLPFAVCKNLRNFAASTHNDNDYGKVFEPESRPDFQEDIRRAPAPGHQSAQRVERIEYWPAEKIPRRTEAEKDSIVDVCCRDNKKREFIVEMQMTWTESFKKRVLLNASKAYVAQTEAGEPYEHHDYRTNCEKLSTSMLSWSVSCKPPCRLAIRQRVFLYLCTS